MRPVVRQKAAPTRQAAKRAALGTPLRETTIGKEVGP